MSANPVPTALARVATASCSQSEYAPTVLVDVAFLGWRRSFELRRRMWFGPGRYVAGRRRGGD